MELDIEYFSVAETWIVYGLVFMGVTVHFTDISIFARLYCLLDFNYATMKCCVAGFLNDNYRDLRTVILRKLEPLRTLQESTA